MTAQARKGRYFPMSLDLVKAAVRQAALRNKDDRSLPVILANPRPSQERESLAGELRPLLDLTLFSLPLATAAEEGTVLWQRILGACFLLRQHKLPTRSGQGPVYAFIGGAGDPSLRIVARWYHFQTRAYRGTDKFTGGLNRRLIRVEEHAVTLPAAVWTGPEPGARA